MVILEIVIFSFALWLGAYLIGRNIADQRLVLTGCGLIAYAAVLGIDVLVRYTVDSDETTILLSWQKWLLLLPALFWLLLLIQITRGDQSWYSRLQTHKNPLAVLIVATIFFGLGVGLIIVPFNIIPQSWLLLGIGLDLFLLGFVIVYLDAFDEGETLLPHITRSLIFSILMVLLFAGQIAVVIILNTSMTLPMMVLLLGTITIAILVQTFSEPLQNLLDKVALVNMPETQQARSLFRGAADAASRRNEHIQLKDLDQEEFARLTRRALSNLGDLPRLSASPLTNLPVVEERLQAQGNPLDTLERATEFRTILTESINRLKPNENSSYQTTDSWRHYNALYYPYVLGLKPYSRRLQPGAANESINEIMSWFRSQVPQRTLYNWQNAAAKLVAIDLRERSWPE